MSLLEFKRQIFHATFGVTFSMLIFFNIVGAWFFFWLFLAGYALSIIQTRRNLPFITWALKHFDRPGNYPGWGALLMTLGIWIVTVLFSDPIAAAAVIILGLGDSASTFFGKVFGKLENPLNKVKSVEGSLIGLLVAMLGAAPFVGFELAFFGSFVAMVFEAITHRMLLNDNLSMPVAAGFAMWLITQVSPGILL